MRSIVLGLIVWGAAVMSAGGEMSNWLLQVGDMAGWSQEAASPQVAPQEEVQTVAGAYVR
ncbi:MAG: hypothetical protein KTR21_03360 [Rhodobacteraceae bacterium]|nr:hypothetical protein [Paracoccaceae bacterium]